MSEAISTLCDQLPGPWATLCQSKRSARFAWAHDGVKACGGWVELLPEGKLATKWGTGTWECDESELLILKLTFGASCHVCRLSVDECKFRVEKRIHRRGGQVTANPKVKGMEVVSAGWPIEPNAHQGERALKASGEKNLREKTLRAKQNAADVAEEKRKLAEERAVAATEAAAEAVAKAMEMDKLAKEAELAMEMAKLARNKATELACRAKKELEDALSEKDTTVGLSRFGFVTPLKRCKDSSEGLGSPSVEKKAKMATEHEPTGGETGSNKASSDATPSGSENAARSEQDTNDFPSNVEAASE